MQRPDGGRSRSDGWPPRQGRSVNDSLGNHAGGTRAAMGSRRQRHDRFVRSRRRQGPHAPRQEAVATQRRSRPDHGPTCATADEDAEPDASPTTPEVPADVPPRAAKRSAPGPALPGTRVPDVAPPRAGRNTSAGRDADGSAPDASADPARPSAARPGEARSGTVTGGVRAGAPAARQGYGSLAPKPDLNAGRPRLDATLPRPAPSRGGGLLPTGRPGQAGGGRSGLPTVPRPSTPAPAPPLQPQPSRVSAEDIGGS